jgi:DNA (cytosine-5)-methyltransferase 1
MNVLDLFSGIGGFSLGLERAGMRTVRFCEIDPYCRAVLQKHWPLVEISEDITQAGFVEGEADIVVGGFPCQDVSLAGFRAGLAGTRSGLWRHLLRAIRLVRPRYAIVENVAALLGNGMGTVLGDLAEIGHDTEWDCIPAATVGALHYRDRVWIISYPNTNSMRPQRLRPTSTGAWCEQQFARLVQDQIQLSVPAGSLRSLSDGVSGRMGQLKGYGNAVVPQIPEIIGRAIMRAVS